MANVTERNARLDQLVKITKSWATKRRDEINHRVASSKRILQGRTGSERLAQAGVQATSALVVTEIDEFLLA
jgi:hypothetical protein